jgi:tRNA(fMet)-specific endonuclease VapC
MRFLLDTNTVSALMRSDPAASRRLLAARPDDVAIAQPVLAELRYGLARLGNSRRRRELEQRLTILLGALEHALWTDEVSQQFGEVKAKLEKRGERVDDFDVAIAAHALAYDAIVVTDNARHFGRIPGIAVETWTG